MGNPDIFQKDITSADFIKLAETWTIFFVFNKVEILKTPKNLRRDI